MIKTLQSKIKGESSNNLPQNGKIIGYLGRFIILISVLMNVPAIRGFLIKAKSILRYAENKNESDKLFVEYILIGTLYSFAMGITTTYLTYESIRKINLML